jgi:hypothetical protein
MATSPLDVALGSCHFTAECPEHPLGDQARLDFSESGWPRARCSRRHESESCEPVWRVSILCEKRLFQEYYCAAALPEQYAASIPDHLRQLIIFGETVV